MTEVVIRRCTVRLVRHGGWSWGADPRRLVRDAVAALPGLLARHVEAGVPEDAEGEISAPIRIAVKVTLAELAAIARAGAAGGSEAAPPAMARVAAAVRSAIGGMPIERTRPAPVPPPEPYAAEESPAAAAQRWAAAVLQILLGWRESGQVDALLRSFPAAAVEAWHEALFAGAAVADPEGLDPEEIRAAIEPVAARAGASLEERRRARIAAVVECAAVAGVAPLHASVRSAIDARLPLPAGSMPAPAPAAAASATVPVTPARRAKVSRAAPRSEIAIAHALPFLMLGPLARTGWLDAVDATIGAAKLSLDLPSFGAALARKALPAPERGWRRASDALAAEAAFAGDGEPRPDEEIAAFARRAGELAPALAAAARRPLLDGRAAGAPLLVCGGRLLVEPDGLFPLAHESDPDDLARCAAEAGVPLLVDEDGASTALLAALDSAGLAFLTPAPPARGESWRPVSAAGRRLWTNRPIPGLVPDALDRSARALAIWSALDARAISREGGPLDEALSLAAGLGLGSLAWELWRAGSPDPLLALERLEGLGASVRFDEDRVRVRLDLGRRRRELDTAGLLRDIPCVPWLGGRRITFGGS